MSANLQSQSEPLPGTVFNSRQARILKVAVILMGLMLVFGFLVLMSAIVYQASRLGERSPAFTGSPAPYSAIGLNLPSGASVSHMALDGDRLAVHVNGAAGPEILVLDLGTGQTVARIRLRSE